MKNMNHPHKFIQVLFLHRQLKMLSSENLLEFFKHMLDNEEKMTIVDGIFRQLYQCGESTSHIVLQDLTRKAHSLNEKQVLEYKHQSQLQLKDIHDISTFEQMPDSIMCHIATHLETREIFTIWNNINHKFIEIGLKPDSLQTWDMRGANLDYSHDMRYYRHLPKFSLVNSLSNLRKIFYDSSRLTKHNFINLNGTKSLRSFEICMLFLLKNVLNVLILFVCLFFLWLFIFQVLVQYLVHYTMMNQLISMLKRWK